MMQIIAFELFELLVFPGIAFMVLMGFLFEWIDRKFFARIQNRYGPLYRGPAGMLQPFADFVKLLSKEDMVPRACDRGLFTFVPLLYATLPLTALFLIPIASDAGLVEFDGDLILLLFIFGMTTIAVFLAGWSSMSRFSILGSVRSVLQMLSYEIPLGLVLIGPAIAAKSLSIGEIVRWQASNGAWFLWLQPIGFAILIICLLAELELIPFDIPEAETEIVAGWRTEFSGRKLAMFRLGRDLEIVLAASVVASIYLGGAQAIGPIPPTISFVLKAVGALIIFSFTRALFARLRIDQMIAGMWKFLLPLAIAQIALLQIELGAFA